MLSLTSCDVATFRSWRQASESGSTSTRAERPACLRVLVMQRLEGKGDGECGWEEKKGGGWMEERARAGS
jgi:hypothetical protein